MAAGRAGRLFASQMVYSANGALKVRPLMPSFVAAGSNYALQNPGTILWEAATVGDHQTGSSRRYDWANKQVVALKTSEVGQFAVSDLQQQPIEIERYSFDKAAMERRLLKKLTVVENRHGDVDVNFEAYLENGDVKSVEVSVPAADFFVTKTLMYSAIPYLHGWPQGLSTGGVEVHAAYMHQPQGGNYDGMDLS